MSARIWLVRHGETAWSRSGQHTGRTDIPLTDAGRANARALAPALAGIDAGLVLCSPLGRARETAALAGLVPDDYDDDLLEWDYGCWEGRTTAQIRADLGDPHWTVWDDDATAGTTPGERLADVAQRVTRVIARCAPVFADGRDCVLVAHATSCAS